ncbi:MULTISPECIES: hypothetical protein [unclassified Vibrio]|uniref:hypothetical protein n=1 Tax=unclassified Vibrio TaxID=2614977 RepID=UPI0012FFD71A|nr:MULTISPECIES: hypothetical protein [unclassified Vibrio]
MSTLTRATKSGFNKMNIGWISGALIFCNFTEFLGIFSHIGLAFLAIVLVVKIFD